MSKEKPQAIKLSKNLTYEERCKYKEIGMPDLTQDHLELFTDDMLNDLNAIITSCSDNQLKANYISEELSDYGFRDVGLGTNIFVMSNPIYPGVVFKFALDDCGIADNINDQWLSDTIPRYAKFIARDIRGLVSVQVRYVTITDSKRIDNFRKPILKLLKALSKQYLIIDLSPDKYFLNYGVGRDGDFVIEDGSDLFPLTKLKNVFVCDRKIGWNAKKYDYKYCKGELEYDASFSTLICKECGCDINPISLRPKKEVQDMSIIFATDGLSHDERLALEQEEEAVLKRKVSGMSVFETADTGEEYSEHEINYDASDPELPDDSDIEEIDASEYQSDSACNVIKADDIEDDIEVPTIIADAKVTISTHYEETVSETQQDNTSDDDDDEDDEEDSLESTFMNLTRVSDTRDVNPKPITPGLTFEVVSENDDHRDEGIYIGISGDFDQAFEDDGIPIYVSTDNGEVWTRAVTANMLKSLINACMTQLKKDGLL